LDKKEKQLFEYYYHKFSERNFDEKDLFSFLLFVQEKANDNKVIHELSHLLIHRDKMTGYVKSYFDNCTEIIRNLEKEKKRRKIENLFSFKEFRNGFNSLFSQFGFEKLPTEIINDFILCIISLLQGISLRSENSNREIGHLNFAASSKEVFLMGNMKTLSKGRYIPVTFPVLSVNNIYEKVTPQDKNDTPYLFNDALIEVININGQLVITFPAIN
jgi:hypothetical protein